MSVTAEEFDDYGDEYEEGGLSGFYVLAIFLTLLAAFLVIVYFAYEKGKASALVGDADLPVVAADPRPVREEVPLALGTDERREVYDRIEGVTPTTVVADEDPARDPLDGFANAPAAATSQAPAAAASEPAVTEPVRTASADTVQKPAAKPAATTSAPKPSAPAAATTVAAKPTPAAPQPVAAAAGTHVVQVGAFGSDDEAMRFYATLSSRIGTMVSEKKADIQVAEVKGKTYHRLRLAPFTSKSAANSYCADLKAKGQDCLVKGV